MIQEEAVAAGSRSTSVLLEHAPLLLFNEDHRSCVLGEQCLEHHRCHQLKRCNKARHVASIALVFGLNSKPQSKASVMPAASASNLILHLVVRTKSGSRSAVQPLLFRHLPVKTKGLGGVMEKMTENECFPFTLKGLKRIERGE